MARRPEFAAGLAGALLAAVLTTACGGGGSPSGAHVQEPVVQGFSPSAYREVPPPSGAVPTFTDDELLVDADLRYQGTIVVFFQGATDVDPASLYLGGDPALGVDPGSVRVEREVPGVGNVILPLRVSLVDAAGTGTGNAVVCEPLPPYAIALGDTNGDGRQDYATRLPEGQYRVGVFDHVRNVRGRPLRDAPVFHTFTVGTSDTVPPRVTATSPVDGEQGVGAGAPPPAPPPGVPPGDIAGVTTSIFGPTSPDVTVTFSEGVRAQTIHAGNVVVVDAGAIVAGGGPPPVIQPAAGYPRLRDNEPAESDHELVWRPDPGAGGFPQGTQISVRVLGAWTDEASHQAHPGTPDHPAPVQDLVGNPMTLDAVFTFGTLALPDLPENPFPETAIWWSATDRVGAIDTINQQGLAAQFLGTSFPTGVPGNVLPPHTDEVATRDHVPGFDPFEINFDGRTNPATCHTWLYVQSPGSDQVAILDSRNGIPVALLDTPSPGGLAVQVGGGSANALLVTNAGANTFTAYGIGSLVPGTRFLNGPLTILKVQPTGNTPRAIAVTPWGGGVSGWNRDGALGGPGVPIVMYADFSDGAVSTIRLSDAAPVRQFALGATAAPNDVVFTPCLTGATQVLHAAISEGGQPGSGRVAWYVSGPGCQTGTRTNAGPDAIVGELTGFDAPDGLDENVSSGTPAIFSVAESGPASNAVSTLGLQAGAGYLPVLLHRFANVGATPTHVAHRASWATPCIALAGSGGCGHAADPTCWIAGTEQDLVLTFPLRTDPTMTPSRDLYVCARGSSQVFVIDLVSGTPSPSSPIAIPDVRFVAGPGTQ
jgi:hypothetical protein